MCNGKSDFRDNIPHKKYMEKEPHNLILNHISKTLASNIDLSFVNEAIKQLITKNKINDNFKIVEETKNGNLNQSTDKVQTLLNGESNGTLDRSPTTPQVVDDKELKC